MPKAKQTEKRWVLIQDNDNGMEIALAKTKERALWKAAEWISVDLSPYSDEHQAAQEIRAEISNENYQRAYDLWRQFVNEWQNGVGDIVLREEEVLE